LDFSLHLSQIRFPIRRNFKNLSKLTGTGTTNLEVSTLTKTVNPKLLITPERNLTVSQEKSLRKRVLKQKKRGRKKWFPEATKVQIGA